MILTIIDSFMILSKSDIDFIFVLNRTDHAIPIYIKYRINMDHNITDITENMSFFNNQPIPYIAN